MINKHETEGLASPVITGVQIGTPVACPQVFLTDNCCHVAPGTGVTSQTSRWTASGRVSRPSQTAVSSDQRLASQNPLESRTRNVVRYVPCQGADERAGGRTGRTANPLVSCRRGQVQWDARGGECGKACSGLGNVCVVCSSGS